MMDSLATMAARLGFHRSSKRLHVIAGATLGVAALVMSSTAIAQESATARFKPLDHTRPLKLQQMPLATRSKEKVQVVITMTVPSVAEARAGVAGHRISAEQHAAIHTQVLQQHATIESSINARGGRILAHYKDALNGMKVEIARGEIAGLESLPGVVQVVPVVKHTRDNVVSVPFIGAPLVWQGMPGFKGEHIKVGIIDTGIDYTHANFGGPGTLAAWTTAQANDTLPADPTMFGPNAPKVKGGTDLAGDAYDADDPTSVPVPDPNPLDCAAHGSHVAGTVAGFGVSNDGTTYTGPYDVAAYSAGFQIGPGVAPLADIYAIKVFGCTGSTNLVTDAIEWAVENDMDVISMSLGSPWGVSYTADAIASDNAAKAGIVVVAAAGNSGPIPYITGTPASGTHVIAAAATDAHPLLPNGVQVTLSSGATAQGQDFNAFPLPSGTIPALILNSGGTLGLGCNASDYPTTGAAGAVVIMSRGTCTFDQKGANAAAAGAVAIVLVNNSPNSITPIIDTVTIPFIIVPLSYNGTFASAPSVETGSVVAANVPNAGYRVAASFTSQGPRGDDGALKPNITAPGVNVISTAMGTGNQGVAFSGTSMATPHVSGVAALAVQAHANWSERAVREAVVQSASPAGLNDYAPRNEGAGLLQAVGATATQVTAHGTEDFSLGLLSFGVLEMTKDFHDSRDVVLRNHGRWPAGFSIDATSSAGSVPSSAVLSRSFVYVNGHDDAQFRVSLDIPAATVGGTHDASGNLLFQDASGYLTLSPRPASSNNGASLTLPYYAVPVARSAVTADLRGGKNPVVRLANRRGLISGNGDFYAWGLYNPTPGTAQQVFVPRAIGVQSNPISETDSVLVFAINTYGRMANPDSLEFDVLIDVNGNGVPDFDLFTADLGSVTTGTINGEIVSVLLNLATGEAFIEALVDAPFNGSIVESAVFASDLGLSPTNPRFTYSAEAFNLTNTDSVAVPGTGSFNAFTPAVANAIFVPIASGATLDVPVFVDPTEIKLTPALGFMVVTEDNVSGGTEATLLKLK